MLAAGAGERFGGRKQLAPLDGRPLLEHVLAAMAQTPLDRVVVVLGAHAGEVRAAVPLHGAEPVVAADWAEGMGASLRAGVAALGFGDEEQARIAAPIGLDLGGLTSEETALSIMAEVVAVRNGRDGGRLSHASGRIHEVGA